MKFSVLFLLSYSIHQIGTLSINVTFTLGLEAVHKKWRGRPWWLTTEISHSWTRYHEQHALIIDCKLSAPYQFVTFKLPASSFSQMLSSIWSEVGHLMKFQPGSSYTILEGADTYTYGTSTHSQLPCTHHLFWISTKIEKMLCESNNRKPSSSNSTLKTLHSTISTPQKHTHNNSGQQRFLQAISDINRICFPPSHSSWNLKHCTYISTHVHKICITSSFTVASVIKFYCSPSRSENLWTSCIWTSIRNESITKVSDKCSYLIR